MLNKISRKGNFDAGHRVMFQKFKCAHLHGHRYEYEMEFGYEEVLDLGYAIDFSELKRIGSSWIDLHLDHTFIVNPLDVEIIKTCKLLKSNHFEMHLVDSRGSCNPTVENICKEIFFAISLLLETENLQLQQIKVYETANCIGTCLGLSVDEIEIFNSSKAYVDSILDYKKRMGQLEYDARKGN